MRGKSQGEISTSGFGLDESLLYLSLLHLYPGVQLPLTRGESPLREVFQLPLTRGEPPLREARACLRWFVAQP